MIDVDCASFGWGGSAYRYVRFGSAPERLDALTAAESEVARLLFQGKTNKQIAQQRNTSPNTVSNQLVVIFSKLGVHSRHELIARLGMALSGFSAG